MDIFISSLFKAGTWMVRDIIQNITGLQPSEPERVGRLPDYGDPTKIVFSPGIFFSWHTEINEETKALLRHREVKCILVMRNVFDLVVSMYHHLAWEVDADIGANAGPSKVLSHFTEEQGLALTISGYSCPIGRFEGLALQVTNMQNMLQFSNEYPVLLTSYERLVMMKEPEIQRIADYLGISISHDERRRIAEGNQFKSMKQKAVSSVGSSHFRKGRPDGHRNIIKDFHALMINHAIDKYAAELPRLTSLDLGFNELLSEAYLMSASL